MAFRAGYRVRITNSAPLTGNFSDANPATGYGTFTTNVASIASGDVVPYYAWDGASQYEEGYLTYTAGSPASLSRTVVRSTNSNLACNFTGSVYISCGIHDDNVVMTDNNHLLMAAGSYNLTMGPGKLSSTQNMAASAWTTSGIREQFGGGTLTDTSSSGTVAAAYTSVRGGNTIAASNAGVTFTDYYEFYAKAPLAGTNVTLTNAWAFGADSARVVTTLKAPDAATWTSSGIANLTKLGVGMAPVNPIDVTLTQNATSTISLLNGSNGTAAAGRFIVKNDVGDISAFGILSSGFTTNGIYTANSTFIQSDGDLAIKAGGSIKFGINASTALVAELSSSGCFGIGMVPVNILDITQTQNAASIGKILNASNGAAASADWRATNDVVDSLRLMSLSSGYATSGVLVARRQVIYSDGVGLAITTSSAQPIIMGIANSEVARFTIDSTNPALFIGCTSAPSTSVHGLEMTSGPSNGGLITMYAGSTSSTAMVFGTTSGQAGTITTSGTTTTYGVSSGADIKNNIVSMSAALAMKLLRASEPSTYIYKVDGSIGHGFVVETAYANAQKHGIDLEALGIVRLKTGKYGAVMDYGKWTPYLSAVAIDHEDRIAALEDELARLKKKKAA